MEANDPIMLSALQHWSYCPRQCTLIHVEQAFDENVFTLRGNAAHERVDDPAFETFEGVRAERALPVWSERLVADLQMRRDGVSSRWAHLSGGIQTWQEARKNSR